MTSQDCDIAIIGAGFAGIASAALLGRSYSVVLVDPLPEQPRSFKAEKIEPDQAEAMRRMGLADAVLPHAAPIGTILEARAGRVIREVRIEQYGMAYQDMVNTLRAAVPASVDYRLGRAVDIETSPDRQKVILADDSKIGCRLVVLAGGLGGHLHEKVGSARRTIRNGHSVATGFDIVRASGEPFVFDALTYWADQASSAIDYVSLFRLPDTMRVNMFSYLDRKDPRLRALNADARAMLDGAMPGLTRLIGDWAVTGKVESRPIDLWVSEPPVVDGVVLIGDASQSVCPATGTGLSKVLTDVEVLCLTHLPQWFRTEGMTAGKIASYFRDERKIGSDRASLDIAEYRRKMLTDQSVVGHLRRGKRDVKETLGLMRARLGLT